MQQRGIDDATKILGKLGTESLKTYENAQNIWVTDDFSDGKSSALIREASVNTATGQITLGANITTAGGGTDLISIEIDGIATDTKDTDPAKRPALTGLDAVRAAFDPDTSRVTRLTTYNGQKPDGPYVYFLSYLGCSRDEHNPSYHCVLKDQSDNEDRSENSLNPTMQANLTALEQELQIG